MRDSQGEKRPHTDFIPSTVSLIGNDIEVYLKTCFILVQPLETK